MDYHGPVSIKDVPTPSFLIDLDIIERNAQVMTDRINKLGIKLRPHMKTLKTLESGVLATSGTKRRICVSTLKEAEFFVRGGFDDILYAALFSAEKIPRLRGLSETLDILHVVVDSNYGYTTLKENPLPKGKKWSVYLLVNTGNKREGCNWNDSSALDLAKKLTDSDCITFRGLYVHEGHSYHVTGRDAVKTLYETSNDQLSHFVEALEERGIQFDEVTIGSTPTASVSQARMKYVSEIHPGNYLAYDCQQHTIGSCKLSDISCRVATRVLGQYPDRHELLIDAGFTAVSSEGPLPNGSFGIFQNYEHIRLVRTSQEYGVVSYDPAYHKAEDFPHGMILYFYPYHACNTSRGYQEYYIHRGDNIEGRWHPCSQW